MKRYYSHSKLEAFEQCPLKYKYCYIDKLPRPEKESIEAFMGNKVHASLKKLYDDLTFKKEVPPDEIIGWYNKMWESGFNDKIFIVKIGRNAEFYKSQGRSFIEKYYEKHFPFNEDETIRTEHRVSVVLDGAGEIIFSGIIDRISKKGDAALVIHDYKTSSRLPSSKDIEKDRQLTMYQIAFLSKEPAFADYSVELVWHYLAFDASFTCARDDENLLSVKNSVIERIEKIESEKEFPASSGPLCAWCDFSEQCPVSKRGAAKEEFYLQPELF